MRRLNLLLVLNLGLIFLSGLVVGGFGYRVFFGNCAKKAAVHKTADEVRKEYVASLKKAVGLEPDQASKIDQILINTRAEYLEIHKRIEPDVKALHERQIAQMRAVLTPAQQVKFDQWRNEREHRGKEKQAKKKP